MDHQFYNPSFFLFYIRKRGAKNILDSKNIPNVMVGNRKNNQKQILTLVSEVYTYIKNCIQYIQKCLPPPHHTHTAQHPPLIHNIYKREEPSSLKSLPNFPSVACSYVSWWAERCQPLETVASWMTGLFEDSLMITGEQQKLQRLRLIEKLKINSKID